MRFPHFYLKGGFYYATKSHYWPTKPKVLKLKRTYLH